MAIPTAVSTGFTMAGRMRITAVIVRYRNGKMRFTLKIQTFYNRSFYENCDRPDGSLEVWTFPPEVGDTENRGPDGEPDGE